MNKQLKHTMSQVALSIAASLIAVSVLAPSSHAKEGPGSGGGGDLMMISQNRLELRNQEIFLRGRWVRGFIEDETRGLKADLIRLIDSLNPEKVRVATSRIPTKYSRIREVLTSRREQFKADVRDSVWELADETLKAWCGDRDGKVKDAATCGDERSRVRFNYHRIARYRVSRKELRQKLVQLAFHEHVRHFGFPDNDNVLAELAGVIEDNDTLVTYEDSQASDALPFKRAMLIILNNLPETWDGSPYEHHSRSIYLKKTLLGIEPTEMAADARIGLAIRADYDMYLDICRDIWRDLGKLGYQFKAPPSGPRNSCHALFWAKSALDVSDELTLGILANRLVSFSTRIGGR